MAKISDFKELNEFVENMILQNLQGIINQATIDNPDLNAINKTSSRIKVLIKLYSKLQGKKDFLDVHVNLNMISD